MRSPDLQIAGVAAVLVASMAVPPHELHVTHQHQYAMGTMWDVIVYHGAQADGERAATDALAEIARLDRVMSHFDPGSELAALVRTARHGVARPGADLYAAIAASLEVSQLSGGRFDITVAPLVRAHRQARDEGRAITPEESAAAQACVGYRNIELGAGTVRFASSCLDIDLGAIGKGYAVDRAIDVLRRSGVVHGLVNAGGSSIRAIGTPPGRDGWAVQVGDGDGEHVTLRDASVSTSESAAPHQSRGEIIDASTGATLVTGLSISAFAPTATMTDALATALLTMPVSDGMRMLDRLPGTSARWRTPSGTVAAVHPPAGAEPPRFPSRP